MRPLRTRPARKRSSLRERSKLPRQLNVGEAKAVFSQLVDAAARGSRFIIAKAGTPVARIVPLDTEPGRFVFGTMKGWLTAQEEQALFDALETPLPDDMLAAFQGGSLDAPDK